jgi:hypothetical protein
LEELEHLRQIDPRIIAEGLEELAELFVHDARLRTGLVIMNGCRIFQRVS